MNFQNFELISALIRHQIYSKNSLSRFRRIFTNRQHLNLNESQRGVGSRERCLYGRLCLAIGHRIRICFKLTMSVLNLLGLLERFDSTVNKVITRVRSNTRWEEKNEEK